MARCTHVERSLPRYGFTPREPDQARPERPAADDRRRGAPGDPEGSSNSIVGDNAPPRYPKAAAALLACDLDLGAELYSLLDSSEPSAASPSVRSVIRA